MKIGIEVQHVKRWSEVDVCFTHDEIEDETSFDIEHILTKSGTYELEILFQDFCRENSFHNVKITSVTVVKTADTYEELEG